MFRFPVSKDGIIDYAAPSNVFFGVTPKPISAPKGSQSTACNWGMLRKYAIAGIHPISATIADQVMIMIAHGEQGTLIDLAKAAIAAVDKDLGMLVSGLQQKEGVPDTVKTDNLNSIFKELHEGVLLTALESLVPQAFPSFPLEANPAVHSWEDCRRHAQTLIDVARDHWYPTAEFWQQVIKEKGGIKASAIVMASRAQFYEELGNLLAKHHRKVRGRSSLIVAYLHLTGREPLVLTSRVCKGE